MKKTAGFTVLAALVAILFLVGPTFANSISLTGTVRDFKFYNSADPTTNQDFETVIATDPGIVTSTLGLDGKPVYAGLAGNPSTHGQAYFDQWYRDVAGTNINIPYTITLTEGTPGIYSFSDTTFFPIDGQGFLNQGQAHNYSFTYELHNTFTYQTGQDFAFTGDDDVFVFINGSW